ncbi:MAG: HlyC/CorC family transporter [Chloroflexi bacterium]|nr:HlyC/CorC family transporter [Chloroflexota bacterium]
MAADIIIVFVLILANGFLALAEFAIVSARKARLEERADSGSRGARAALALVNEPGQFLSTVQVGITLVGILAGAFGGTAIAEGLAPLLAQVPALQPYSNGLSLAVVVLLITFLTLVLGELAPKRLALANAEKIASAIAPFMRAMSKLFAPVVRLLSASTDLVIRILGVKPSTEPAVTEDEVKGLMEHGARVGVFEPIEEEMVGRVFRLGDRSVSALITPRPEVIWLDVNDPPEDIRAKIIAGGHSHFPVAEGSLDNLLGLVRSKDLLAQSLLGQPINLREMLIPALYVPEGMPAFDMLERFRETRSQIAVVVDEYGGVLGLVTLNDMLEAIVGDLPEPDELEEAEVTPREDGSWLVDGGLPMDEFQDLFDLRELPDEGEQYYQTLGGFVMTFLGRIPASSDSFEWGNLRFEVMDMDGLRVDKVLVTPIRVSEEMEGGAGI